MSSVSVYSIDLRPSDLSQPSEKTSSPQLRASISQEVTSNLEGGS